MKPHIKKINGLWCCGQVCAENPKKAWIRWKVSQVKNNLFTAYLEREGA